MDRKGLSGGRGNPFAVYVADVLFEEGGVFKLLSDVNKGDGGDE